VYSKTVHMCYFVYIYKLTDAPDYAGLCYMY